MKLIFTLQGRLGNIFYIFSAFYYALKHNFESYLYVPDYADYVYGYLTSDEQLVMLYNKIKKFLLTDNDKNKFEGDEILIGEESEFDNIISNNLNNDYKAINNINLACFFQTSKYFLEYKDDIKKYFINETDNVNKYKCMISDNDVFIHVRQGDYIYAGFYVLNKEYYIDMYNKYFKGKNVFITSDDIDWCKENLTIDKFINCQNLNYIDNLNPIETITLAQYFSNFICSNSTFAMMAELFSNYENKKAIGVVNVSKENFIPYAFDNKCIICNLNDKDNYKYITKY